MEAATLSQFRLEFAKRAEARRDDERRTVDQIRQKEDKDKKVERDQKAAHDALLDSMLAVLASDADIAAFHIKLDTYDSATVEALMENDEALAAAREEIRLMLDKAYVLPDGRKVFKTEDGTRVFDEHGIEVEDFDSTTIEDWRPRWEEFRGELRVENELVQQREKLIKFQEQLDEAREASNADGLTKSELEELERRLEENAPEAIKAKLAKDGPERNAELADAPKPETAFRPAGKLDMPAL
jgi:hypothetical protein